MRGASLLGWPVVSSLAVHVAGLAAASSLIVLAPPPRTPVPVAIDVVRAEPPPPSPLPPKSVETVERIISPRVVMQPSDVPAPTPLAPAPLERHVGIPTSPLATGGGAPDARLFAASSGSGQPLPGRGNLFAKGDLLLPAGGADGGEQVDVGGQAAARRVAGIPQQSADGGGLSELARPLGGYQTKPTYPESARRQGIEGITTLRFEVRSDGHVGRVAVARTAGHAALDRAAMEAVKSWLFEPARRGKEAVAVWVTLPVQFRLQGE